MKTLDDYKEQLALCKQADEFVDKNFITFLCSDAKEVQAPFFLKGLWYLFWRIFPKLEKPFYKESLLSFRVSQKEVEKCRKSRTAAKKAQIFSEVATSDYYLEDTLVYGNDDNILGRQKTDGKINTDIWQVFSTQPYGIDNEGQFIENFTEGFEACEEDLKEIFDGEVNEDSLECLYNYLSEAFDYFAGEAAYSIAVDMVKEHRDVFVTSCNGIEIFNSITEESWGIFQLLCQYLAMDFEVLEKTLPGVADGLLEKVIREFDLVGVNPESVRELLRSDTYGNLQGYDFIAYEYYLPVMMVFSSKPLAYLLNLNLEDIPSEYRELFSWWKEQVDKTDCLFPYRGYQGGNPLERNSEIVQISNKDDYLVSCFAGWPELLDCESFEGALSFIPSFLDVCLLDIADELYEVLKNEK